MKREWWIIIAVLGLQACGDPDKYKDEDGKLSGKIIYQKECVLCHGEDGDDGRDGAADLSRSLLGTEDMEDAVQHGRGDMSAIDYLTDEEVKLVIQYVEEHISKKKAK